MDRVRHILHEGNVRHAVVESKGGHRFVDLPLTLVIVGAAFAPWLAAIGVVIAVVAGCSLRVERHGETAEEPGPATELASDVSEAAGEAVDTAKAAADEARDAAASVADEAKDAAASLADEAKDAAAEVADAAEGATEPPKAL